MFEYGTSTAFEFFGTLSTHQTVRPGEDQKIVVGRILPRKYPSHVRQAAERVLTGTLTGVATPQELTDLSQAVSALNLTLAYQTVDKFACRFSNSEDPSFDKGPVRIFTPFLEDLRCCLYDSVVNHNGSVPTYESWLLGTTVHNLSHTFISLPSFSYFGASGLSGIDLCVEDLEKAKGYHRKGVFSTVYNELLKAAGQNPAVGKYLGKFAKVNKGAGASNPYFNQDMPQASSSTARLLFRALVYSCGGKQLERPMVALVSLPQSANDDFKQEICTNISLITDNGRKAVNPYLCAPGVTDGSDPLSLDRGYMFMAGAKPVIVSMQRQVTNQAPMFNTGFDVSSGMDKNKKSIVEYALRFTPDARGPIRPTEDLNVLDWDDYLVLPTRSEAWSRVAQEMGNDIAAFAGRDEIENLPEQLRQEAEMYRKDPGLWISKVTPPSMVAYNQPPVAGGYSAFAPAMPAYNQMPGNPGGMLPSTPGSFGFPPAPQSPQYPVPGTYTPSPVYQPPVVPQAATVAPQYPASGLHNPATPDAAQYPTPGAYNPAAPVAPQYPMPGAYNPVSSAAPATPDAAQYPTPGAYNPAAPVAPQYPMPGAYNPVSSAAPATPAAPQYPTPGAYNPASSASPSAPQYHTPGAYDTATPAPVVGSLTPTVPASDMADFGRMMSSMHQGQ